MMFTTVMNLYIIMIMTYWLCESLVIDLFVSVLLISLSSVMTYFTYDSPWFFYMMMLSMVGGFMVLMSFTMMSLPNYSYVLSKTNELMMNLIMSLIFLFTVILFMKLFYSPDSINMMSSYSNQIMKSCFFVIFPFVMMLMFLLIILIMMLLVIDSIIVNKKGSVKFMESL